MAGNKVLDGVMNGLRQKIFCIAICYCFAAGPVSFYPFGSIGIFWKRSEKRTLMRLRLRSSYTSLTSVSQWWCTSIDRTVDLIVANEIDVSSAKSERRA